MLDPNPNPTPVRCSMGGNAILITNINQRI